MLAGKKASHFIRNKVTLNWKILALLLMRKENYAASEKWQKIFICICTDRIDLIFYRERASQPAKNETKEK